MNICNIFKGTKSVNRYRKSIVIAAIVAVIMCIFVGCQQAYSTTAKAPTKASVPASTEVAVLSQKIKQLVKGLEYSDKVAQELVNMVRGWKDEKARPVLVDWMEKLAEAKEDYKQGKISKAQLAKVEESVAKQLSQRIRIEISYNKKFFELAEVIKHRQADCCGYTQLAYILGNSIGLSVKATSILEIMTGVLPPGVGHVACIVGLADAKTIMVDSVPGGFVSKPFIVEEEFAKVGNYWELKNKDNPLRIHRRIQILDRNGLLAGMYHLRGILYRNLGQHAKAISAFAKAIELNPKFADAYDSRGVAYYKSGELIKAISDYTKVIELNPKFAKAYNNRGAAYDGLGEHTKAISDYNKAIEFNPKDASAYSNRGMAYRDLGQYTKAVSDQTKAIELNPKFAEAYYNRGFGYGDLGQPTKAIFDFTKVIELNPKNAKAYCYRGLAQALLGNLEKARKDLLKAVKLNPTLKVKIKDISDQFKLNLDLDLD